MKFKLALIVDHAAARAKCDTTEHLASLLASCGLESLAWSEAEVAGAVRQGDARPSEPVLVVLGPDLDNPIGLGRTIRSMWSGTHLLFIQYASRAPDFRKALSHAPMLGFHWSLSEYEDLSIAEQVRSAIAATRRRTQLRMTLDGVNTRLAVRPAGVEDNRRANSEYYLANFLAQASESILALDASGHVLYWNASARQLLEMDEEQLARLELAHLPFWSPQLGAAVAAAADGQGIARCELAYRRGNEELFLDIGCSAVRDKKGQAVGLTLVITDVSERHRFLEAERQEHRLVKSILVRERARILELFDLAPGFMFLLHGPDHVIELTNPAFSQLFGKEQLQGLTMREAFPELASQHFLAVLDQVYRSGEPFVGRMMPVRICHADEAEHEIYLDFVYQPVIDERGRIGGVFCQGTDVTPQKQAQDELLRHQMQLEQLVGERTASLRSTEQALLQAQKLESIGKLTGGVAHDFNNILQVIGGNLDLLKSQFRGESAVFDRLSQAAEAVGRGAKLASQLLSFARKQPLAPLPTNLARIVRNMDSLLRRALGDAIEIETVIGGGLWTAMVDRNQLENVILNLAINARDAMDGQGLLTIELGNALLDDHYAEQNSDVAAGQYVMLAVSDTGKGMTADIVARVFEPFYTTKPEGEGTGLGLSMAYGFVKQSAGHIKIYSEPGSGTTVKVYLPRVHQAEASVGDFRPMPAVGGSETILVVEDDPAVRSTVVDLLTDLGYMVLKAVDGQSGLNVLQSGIPIDLLFTDVVMPGPVRSTELARQAKELHPEIQVLFTSGYTQNAIVHGGRLDQGVELISKPYRREDLARKIRSLLAADEEVSVESAPGQSDAPASQSVASDGKRSVLVVEDNEDARQMLCELLDFLGYQVQGAASGEAALVDLKERRFDILLTDVGLPGMNGKDLARQAVILHDGVKVVFTSGFGNVEVEFPSRSLPKPYTLQDLENVLAEL